MVCSDCEPLARKLELALKRIEVLEKHDAEREKKLVVLEARLALYENPNTPSSQKRFPERKTREEPSGRLGRPPGYEGSTRPTPKPDRVIDTKPSGCKCGWNKIRILQEFSKIVEDVEIRRIATKFIFYQCQCTKCGLMFETTHENLPKEGVFGPTLISIWNALHYQGAVPFKRLADFSEKCLGVPITPSGLMEAVYRSAHVFQPFYDETGESLPSANYACSDETSYSFNGSKYWLWNFSNHDVSFVKIVDSRASAVPKQVLGENFKGVLNTDCYPGYDSVKADEKQKCWAHLLREAKQLSEHYTEGKRLYAHLKHMYSYVKKVKEEHREGKPRVKGWVTRSIGRFHQWIKHKWRFKKVRTLVKRIARYECEWFTCLKYDFVEATNNGSERDVRKNVIARKISGLHRSERGVHSREIMMSVLLTMPKKGVNAYGFVLNGLKAYNLSAA